MKKLDLSGQTFGMLTVIKEAEPRTTSGGRKKTQWLCQCECGREKVIETSNLRSGHSTNCGCKTGRVSHIGETFGRLLAKEYIIGGYYLCECNCGNVIKVKTANLVNGNTQSCGCLQKERTMEANYISLVGKTFGRLTVLERDKTIISPYVMYKCQCECGNTVIVNAQNLRTGTTKSCGCLKKELSYYRNKKDLLNQRFGKLKVVEETSKREERSIIWKCLCDCGNTTYVSSRSLIHAKVASCGCLLSKGEEFIAKYLRDNNISFIQQYTFDDCLSPNGRKLRFDFFVANQILIEYDGSQHYDFTGYDWNTEKNYQKTVTNDKIKDDYCKNNNLKLIRIPYWEFDNLEKILYNIIREVNLLNE